MLTEEQGYPDNWLQLFAGPEDDEDIEDSEENLVTDDEDVDDDSSSDENNDDDDASAEPDPNTPPKGKGPDQTPGKIKTFTQEQVDAIIQQRLARVKPETKVNLLESLAEQANVGNLAEEDLTKSAQLWSYLKHNPEISKAVDRVLADMRGQAAPGFQGKSKPANQGESLELFQSRIDLRTSDSLFRKHEKDVLSFAKKEGIEVTDPRSLSLVYKAWKGENAKLLAANAELRGQQRGVQGRQAVNDARGVQRKGGAKGKPMDYRKASISEVLAAEGINLFDED